QGNLRRREQRLVLEPESIAVHQPAELIDQDDVEQLPDHRAGGVLFGESADPEIDLIDISVDRQELRLDLRIEEAAAEIGRGQPEGHAGVVVASEAVIASALDVERREILAERRAR